VGIRRDDGAEALLRDVLEAAAQQQALFAAAFCAAPAAHNVHGHTPLHVAAAHGYARCIPALLAATPNGVAAADAAGRTPLHLAARHGHARVVRLLLKADAADAAAAMRDAEGNVPLALAYLHHHDRLLALLRPRSPPVDLVALARSPVAAFLPAASASDPSSDDDSDSSEDDAGGERARD